MRARLRSLKRLLGAGLCPRRCRPALTAIVIATGLLLPSAPLLREFELNESLESSETECYHLRATERAGETELSSRRSPRRATVVAEDAVLHQAAVRLVATSHRVARAFSGGHRLANGLSAPLRL